MIPRSTSRIVKRLFAQFGVDIQKIEPKPVLDLSRTDIDPIAASYLDSGASILLRLPLERCVYENVMAFKCDSRSPYVRTILEYSGKKCTAYAGSWLELLHSQFQPRNAAELMGIDTPSYADLERIPARGALFPWERVSPQQKYHNMVAIVECENCENGSTLLYSDGDKFFGPCSRSKGELEYKRLIATYNSIATSGFNSCYDQDDKISGIFLVSDDQTEGTMLVRNGQHRVAALAAIGARHVTVQLNRRVAGGVVRRTDAPYWPAVRAGYLTLNEALALFDRIAAGRQPAAYVAAVARMSLQRPEAP